MVDGGVCAPKGFQAGGIHCGIRANTQKKDLAMILSDKPCTAAGVYTKNKVKGAPILVTQEHIAKGEIQGVICNSGNANTCNADGIQIAQAVCSLAADASGISQDAFIIGSTGVIGQPLPLEPFEKGIPVLAKQLSYDGSDAAANAIMTTDTVKKECAVSFTIQGKTCAIGAIAKGSGMIHPNMATMLCFITTDVAISADMLQKALSEDIQDTFNMISVDRDTSTNDTVTIMANGMAGTPAITEPNEDFILFAKALRMVTESIAKWLAKDGEGATKLLECRVSHAPDVDTAKAVAKSVITSSLFKAAMFGADANWGRILCAIGYTDKEFDIGKVAVWLESDSGSVHVCQDGAGVAFSEEQAKEILLKDEIIIRVDLNQGTGEAAAWGCDLTYDYVKINGDYRS